MSDHPDTIWCDGCGAEIQWAPVRSGALRYCCQDCLEDRGCRCAERQEVDADEHRQAVA